MSIILSSLFVAINVAQPGAKRSNGGGGGGDNNPACAGMNCRRCLMRDDFTHGTFRITTSGKYCLGENILFDPVPETPVSTDWEWFPQDANKYPACDTLKGGAFAMGFFAAISIETSDVEIDLNNFVMRCSLSFYSQQRFFSQIEIGTAPYMQGFGPANFGPAEEHSNIYIHDGSLGLSSHHAVHSNEAHNVRLERLQISSFGVCHFYMHSVICTLAYTTWCECD